MIDELKIDLLKVMVKHKLVSEIHFRNEEIKQKYKQQRANGEPGKEIKKRLSEEYFISFKQIERILYNKEKD